MDLETLKDLASVASFALSIGAMIYAFFATRKKDNDQRFSELSAQNMKLTARMTKAETLLNAVPSREDIHGIHLEIASMNGAVGRMEAVMEGNAKIMGRLESIVSRHEDHLLNQRN